MANNARKAVQTALIDNWSRGAGVAGMFTDMGTVVRGGDSVDIPYRSAAPTVYSSESMAVATPSLGNLALAVDQFVGTNEAVTVAQYDQLLNGNGAVANQLVRSALGTIENTRDRNLIAYMIGLAADVAATPVYHVNVAANAVTGDDVAAAEALLRDQDGIANDEGNLFWLANPMATASIKSAADYVPAQPSSNGQLGMGIPASLNGIRYLQHSGVPGRATAKKWTVASSAWAIVSNVLTITVPAGHGFVAGQMVSFDTVTAGGDLSTATAITSVTATTIVLPKTAANANATEVGTVSSESSYAMLCYSPWLYYADTGRPRQSMIDREANAGWNLKMSNYFGRIGYTGAVVILHAPVSVA